MPHSGLRANFTGALIMTSNGFRISGITILTALLFSMPVRGQNNNAAPEVVMSYPILNADRISELRLKDIDVNGRKATLTFDPNMGVMVIIPRGETLLLAQDSKTRQITRAFRGNVTEMLEKGEAIFEFDPEAASELRPGPVLLVYPFEGLVDFGNKPAFPVTSKKFRQLPEIIRMASDADGKGKESIENARQREAHSKSVNNLKRILLAMHNFHSVNGHFPPAVVFGPDGKPWHSWRVLILPYLEQSELYNKYDFSQPWDSPTNKTVADTALDIYKDPVYGNSSDPVTHYAAIVGDKAMFRPKGAQIKDTTRPLDNMKDGSTKIFEITDGTSATLMIVPIASDRKIPWAKPEDIEFGPNFPELGKPGGIALPYKSLDGKGRVAPVAKADGSVMDLKEETPLRIVRSLITISGGEIYEEIPNIFPPDNRATPKFPIFRILKTAQGTFSAKLE
jgi:hypothetical protein